MTLQVVIKLSLLCKSRALLQSKLCSYVDEERENSRPDIIIFNLNTKREVDKKFDPVGFNCVTKVCTLVLISFNQCVCYVEKTSLYDCFANF